MPIHMTSMNTEMGVCEDYGYCWRPAAISADGAIRFGRWTWIGGDYVWISYEPWVGPRTIMEDGRMSHPLLCWVPPARVQCIGALDMWLVHTPHTYHGSSVAREIYYGYGYYGPTVSTSLM